MTRAVEWAPLAAMDPVPGDPDVVRGHARHLAAMADDIAGQVVSLRRIAGAEGLEGEYVAALSTGAGRLADRLGRVEGRYREVSAALGSYAPELEAAQAESLRILRRAQVAEEERQRHERALATLPPVLVEPASLSERSSLQAQQEATSAEVQRARRDLSQVEDARDRAAAAAARRIREGIDDSVVDSWWDRTKEWVHNNATWLKWVGKALGYIGVAILVLSLIIPGVNVLSSIALGVAFAGLATHSALALAGEGSWADVALDVVGLATLGTGKLAVAGARSAQGAVRLAGALEKGRRAAASVRGMSSAERAFLQRVVAEGGPDAQRALPLLEALEEKSARVGRDVFRRVVKSRLRSALPDVDRLENLALGAGDRELSVLVKDVRMISEELGDAPGVGNAAARFAVNAGLARGMFGASNGAGVFGAAADTLHGGALRPWRSLGDRWTQAVGSTW